MITINLAVVLFVSHLGSYTQMVRGPGGRHLGRRNDDTFNNMSTAISIQLHYLMCQFFLLHSAENIDRSVIDTSLPDTMTQR
jgi:hypothetical protein